MYIHACRILEGYRLHGVCIICSMPSEMKGSVAVIGQHNKINSHQHLCEFLSLWNDFLTRLLNNDYWQQVMYTCIVTSAPTAVVGVVNN